MDSMGMLRLRDRDTLQLSRMSGMESSACSCGQAVLRADQFCGYCGKRNDRFDLAAYNNTVQSLPGAPFLSPEAASAFCQTQEGLAGHEANVVLYDMALQSGEDPPYAIFCTECGKLLVKSL